MKSKLIFLMLLLLCVGASGQRGARIGYIDMAYILENVPEYKAATTQLETKVEKWQKEVEKLHAQVEQMKLNLSNEQVLLTKELIEEREEEIELKEAQISDYQQKRFGPQGDLIKQKKQLIQPVQDQVFNVVQEIAANRKYDFIFDKSADIVMLYAAKRHDISDLVLRFINRSNKRKQLDTKKEKKDVEKRDALSFEEDKEVTKRELEIEKNKKAKEDRRNKLVEEKKKQRDEKINEAKRKRDERIEATKQKRDSIIASRKNKAPNTINSAKDEKTKAPKTKDSPDPKNSAKEEKKRIRDSIRAIKKEAFEARRKEFIERRQQQYDSIVKLREEKKAKRKAQKKKAS